MVEQITLNITPANEKNIHDFLSINSEENIDYFKKCLTEQKVKNRVLYIAYRDKIPVAYGQLVFTPRYNFFKKMKIPEIQDLFVKEEYRGKGIGQNLIEYIEQKAKNLNFEHIGISVSVSYKFGTAQRLYIKMGYIPDGFGVVYSNKRVNFGEYKAVDDLLCLKFIKKLT